MPYCLHQGISSFMDAIKDPWTNKAYEKSNLVVYAYNNKKKNIMLGHLPQILRVS